MKKLISIIVSLLILVLIYWRIDFQELLEVLGNSNIIWLIISICMVVPITMLIAWKFKKLVPSHVNMSFYQSIRLILLASVLNMVLPSKMGDVAKAYFIKGMGELGGSMALSLVVFEKVLDVLSLLLWCSFGLLFLTNQDLLFLIMTFAVIGGFIFGILILSSSSFASLFFKLISIIVPAKFQDKIESIISSWLEYREYIWSQKKLLISVCIISMVTWFFHLLQIWFFIFALNQWVPITANFALSSLSIFAGLLPLTFAGIGTRDAAIIFFFQGFLTTPVAAALGVLCTLRYVLPALGGIPFLWKYSHRIQSIKKSSLSS